MTPRRSLEDMEWRFKRPLRTFQVGKIMFQVPRLKRRRKTSKRRRKRRNCPRD